jgi:prolyl oligopeptidase
MSSRQEYFIKGLRYLGTLSVFVLLALTFGCTPQEKVTPPPTRVEEVVDVVHGVEIVDPYRWLEDQWSEETRAWIDAQNEFTDSLLKPLTYQEKIEEILNKLIRVDTKSRPRVRENRYFYTKRSADQELPIICMREGFSGQEQVLIDPHPMSEDKTTSVGIYDTSRDGKLLVYYVRQGGEDEIEIRFFDVDTKADTGEKLAKARYLGLELLPDKSGYYYVRRNPEGPRLYFRAMGEEPGKETYIYGEGITPDRFLNASLSDDGKYLLITDTLGWARNDLYIKDLSEDGEFVPMVTGVDALFYSQFGGDKVYIWSNEGAPNGRIYVADPSKPAKENWQEIVSEREYPLRSFSAVGGRLFLSFIEDVITRVEICDTNGEVQGIIAVPGIGTVGRVSGEWDGNEAFYTFESFNVPETITCYEVDSGEEKTWHRDEVPFDAEKYVVKQVFYESKDGTRIPMFIVHGKEIELDGSNPTFLTGYGGFSASELPGFSPRIAAWLELGGVFAQPSLRGGGEYGEKWHRAGKLGNKQNVFDDFIAAAEYLISEKYTSPEKLAIAGGSNGGLLVGAAMTQRPELFRAVVCSFPLLDMVRYHKFLVGSTWVAEYGSAENPEQFKFIYEYSPYHHVKKGEKYPSVMFITGDADTRVDPLHARKMTALMQASTGSDYPVILRYHTKSGHSGGEPVAEQVKNSAEMYAYILWQLGVEIK